jgi:hypothetical protein
MGADKISPQRTRPMSQLQLRKSHTNTNRQDNIVMGQLQVLGTIPRSTRGRTRKDAKEPIKLGKFLRTDQTIRRATTDCPQGRADCSEKQARTVRSTKVLSNQKTTSLSKQSAERFATTRGLSASRRLSAIHGMSANHTRTVRGRIAQKTANPQEHLPKVVSDFPNG